MAQPLVSVVIPTYNRLEWLLEAIDSALAQTYTNMEVIVIDDGSNDGTGGRVHDRFGSQVRYFWQENVGESAARNRGIECAAGELIAFLDSDDLWLPEKIERQVTLLQARPEIGLVFCQAYRMHADGTPWTLPPEGVDLATDRVTFTDLCAGNVVSGGGSSELVRRDVLFRAGLFDERIKYGEDWDLWLRISHVAEIVAVQAPLVRIRMHRNGQWWTPRPETVDRCLQDHLRILTKAMDTTTEPTPRYVLRRSVAREYAHASLANYAYANPDAARQQMATALEIDLPTWSNEGQLARAISNLALALSDSHVHQSFSVNDYVRSLPLHLLPQFGGLTRRRRSLIARVHMHMGYAYEANSDIHRARRHLLAAMLHDPRCIRNWGAVKTLLRTTASRG